MNPYRYVASKMAQEKNPYVPGTISYDAWMDGFIETVMPRVPSKWTVAMMALCLAPALLFGAALGLLLIKIAG